jgi:hypothetical protein
MVKSAILRRISSGRGGIPLNPEDEEEEEGDNVRFRGSGYLLRLFFG